MNWGFKTQNGDVVITDSLDDAIAKKKQIENDLNVECTNVHFRDNYQDLYTLLNYEFDKDNV